MIVLDENLHGYRILAAWSPGKVISVTSLRRGSLIKDEVIPVLLRTAVQPTFVTINVADFWRKVKSHNDYCIITVDLPQERAREVPDLVRRLFRIPDFKTKASRMGKVIYLTQDHIEYYELDRRIKSLPWPD
jgi:hypothetical protein